MTHSHASASLVVQSLVGKDWTLDASDNSSPLVRFANFTDGVLLVSESTSKESAILSVFPHVVN